MEIVAERTLQLDLPDGSTPPIRVVVGKPELLDSGDWAAPYEIQGPGADEVCRRTARGVDSMQALLLALWILPQELARYAQRGQLSHDGDPDLGFGPPAAP